jgi:twitching motility protein PilT
MATRVLALIDLLQQAAARGASDLHVAPGFPPTFRVGGELGPAEIPALWADDTAHLIGELLADCGFADQFERFLTDRAELDCGLTLDGAGRVRANIYLAQHAVAGAFRLVRDYVPTVGELGLPDIALSLVQRPAGLLIITGPTGHGKTTSQAALLQALAQRVRRHILTIEDPIEYTLVAGQSLIG